MFIDKYKWLDRVEDQNLFLPKIEELKSYIIEFDTDSIIKVKEYSINYMIGGDEY